MGIHGHIGTNRFILNHTVTHPDTQRHTGEHNVTQERTGRHPGTGVGEMLVTRVDCGRGRCVSKMLWCDVFVGSGGFRWCGALTMFGRATSICVRRCRCEVGEIAQSVSVLGS